MKQQLLVISRSRRRAPNLSALDRFLFGFWSLFLNPLPPSASRSGYQAINAFEIHDMHKKHKYCLLYLSGRRGKPGPKGPSQELIQAIVELKLRNPRFGCPQIAQQINKAFGIDIDKDVVRRVLAAHYRPGPGDGGPSWLTFLGHTKDSPCSIDLFRCESILLKSHWILVIMDQFTWRIIGFGVHAGDIDGAVLYRLFNTASSTQVIPHYHSSDYDPLFRYHRWLTRFGDGALWVIDDDFRWHAVEVFERAAVTAEPGLNALIAHQLGVLMSAPREYHNEHPGFEHFAGMDVNDLWTLAEIDLCGIAGGKLQHGSDLRRFLCQRL